MYAALMATFACVIGAAALVAVGLLTSRLHALAKGWDYRLEALSKRIETTTPATLRAEVDDLRGALDVIRASNRKEFGSLWGRLGGKANGEAIPTTQLADGSFEALLDLQGRPPVGPGG